MGGGGHLHDMNRRIKQNRELLKGKRVFAKQLALMSNLALGKRKLRFKKATPEQIEETRDTVIRENRKSDIRKLWILLFVTLTSIAIWISWSWLSEIIGA